MTRPLAIWQQISIHEGLLTLTKGLRGLETDIAFLFNSNDDPRPRRLFYALDFSELQGYATQESASGQIAFFPERRAKRSSDPEWEKALRQRHRVLMEHILFAPTGPRLALPPHMREMRDEINFLFGRETADQVRHAIGAIDELRDALRSRTALLAHYASQPQLSEVELDIAHQVLSREFPSLLAYFQTRRARHSSQAWRSRWGRIRGSGTILGIGQHTGLRAIGLADETLARLATVKADAKVADRWAAHIDQHIQTTTKVLAAATGKTIVHHRQTPNDALAFAYMEAIQPILNADPNIRCEIRLVSRSHLLHGALSADLYQETDFDFLPRVRHPRFVAGLMGEQGDRHSFIERISPLIHAFRAEIHEYTRILATQVGPIVSPETLRPQTDDAQTARSNARDSMLRALDAVECALMAEVVNKEAESQGEETDQDPSLVEEVVSLFKDSSAIEHLLAMDMEYSIADFEGKIFDVTKSDDIANISGRITSRTRKDIPTQIKLNSPGTPYSIEFYLIPQQFPDLLQKGGSSPIGRKLCEVASFTSDQILPRDEAFSSLFTRKLRPPPFDIRKLAKYERNLLRAFLHAGLGHWGFAETYCQLALSAAEDRLLYPWYAHEALLLRAIARRHQIDDATSVDDLVALYARTQRDLARAQELRGQIGGTCDPRLLREQGTLLRDIHLDLQERQVEADLPSISTAVKLLEDAAAAAEAVDDDYTLARCCQALIEFGTVEQKGSQLATYALKYGPTLKQSLQRLCASGWARSEFSFRLQAADLLADYCAYLQGNKEMIFSEILSKAATLSRGIRSSDVRDLLGDKIARYLASISPEW